MRILHIAVFTPESTNVWQADAFESLGHEVIRYDYRAMVKKYGNVERDKHLISLCRNENPDFSLFSKCNNVDIKVVEECGKIGKTVLWYMDSIGNVNAELMQKMQKSDYIFCAGWDGYYEGVKHNKNTFRIHEGYNPKTHYPMDVSKVHDVCFIGELRADRAVFRREVSFDVVTGAFNEEHARTVSETKINLNFTTGGGTSDRTYKVLAAKGFLLTEPWHKMGEDFEIGEDLDVFTSPKNLQERIEYYLEHEEKRGKIAEHGYKTVQKYDNINYAKKILEIVS